MLALKADQIQKDCHIAEYRGAMVPLAFFHAACGYKTGYISPLLRLKNGQCAVVRKANFLNPFSDTNRVAAFCRSFKVLNKALQLAKGLAPNILK